MLKQGNWIWLLIACLCQQSTSVNTVQPYLSEHSSHISGLEHRARPLNVCTMYSVMFERPSLLPLYSGAAQHWMKPRAIIDYTLLSHRGDCLEWQLSVGEQSDSLCLFLIPLFVSLLSCIHYTPSRFTWNRLQLKPSIRMCLSLVNVDWNSYYTQNFLSCWKHAHFYMLTDRWRIVVSRLRCWLVNQHPCLVFFILINYVFDIFLSFTHKHDCFHRIRLHIPTFPLYVSGALCI